MIDSAFAKRIEKLSDDELERQTSVAFMSANYESFGTGGESRADAQWEYRMLEQERKRRKSLK
jgi:hypothetical protein